MINEGIAREGAFYLLSLRLVPVVPFFVINLAMGLTRIKTSTFFLVSQVGMLAGTLVYVNAGTQLSQIKRLSDIASVELMASFGLLGVFPLLAKKTLGFIKRRRSTRKFARPETFDYNLVVIGAGSGGLVSAYIASTVKAKVALIEKHKMGGDCLNTGCVPSKALIRSAKLMADMKRSAELGIATSEPSFDFKDVMERVQRVIQKIEPHDSVDRYTKLGVDVIQGEARLKTPYEIEVDGRIITAKNIIIATGARPLVPQLAGLQEMNYYTSDSIWQLRAQPKRLVVLGGGSIGSELAQAFQRLGSQVTQIEQAERLMGKEDPEVGDFIQNKFKAEGIRVLTNHQAMRFEEYQGEQTVVCRGREGETRVAFDAVLIALGRRANVSGFGAEELGLELTSRGTFAADPFMRTNYPNIFVCGDVTSTFQFTHVASHEAWFATVNALFGHFKKFRADYSLIPWATYTSPEVGRVGLNEEQAIEMGIDHEITVYQLDELDRAITDEEDEGFLKVLTKPGSDQILGVTIVGSHASDMLAEFVLAMKHKIGLNKILGTIHVYPSFAEANKFVAGQWRKARAPEKILAWVAAYHRWQRGHGFRRSQLSQKEHA
jgi:pyruvate/2-oxoglutarate dehydrogenase complex dihydrolipoamide dehydrogenase (E3) component